MSQLQGVLLQQCVVCHMWDGGYAEWLFVGCRAVLLPSKAGAMLLLPFTSRGGRVIV
jgi:hypothetical protein